MGASTDRLTRRAFLMTTAGMVAAAHVQRARAAALAACSHGVKVGSDLSSWPEGCSPLEIGARVARRFVATPMPTSILYNGVPLVTDFTNHIGYWESCAWYGALTFARLARDATLAHQLRERFEPLFGPKAALVPFEPDWHYPAFGAVACELYLQTRDTRYLSIGKRIADAQWMPLTPERLKTMNPQADRSVLERAAAQGLSSQWRVWFTDEAYLITIPQIQAFRATGDAEYLDRAAREIVAYIDKLQQPNGLFKHSETTAHFWGRANGWAAAAMAEILSDLAESHTDRPRILRGYRAMMAALLKYQHEDGLWTQLIDHPEAWRETSGSAMFTFAFVTGVQEGLLDAGIYASAARKAWMGLTAYINEDADLREVSEGTYISADPQYYLKRKRLVGDLHGQAAILWCASALLRAGNVVAC